MTTLATHPLPPPPRDSIASNVPSPSDTLTTPVVPLVATPVTAPPPTDSTTHPCSDTVDAPISHSDLNEHPPVDPVMPSPSKLMMHAIISESFVAPDLIILDSAVQWPPPMDTE